MLSIRKAQSVELTIISELAQAIWHPTYAAILSKDQIEFMLEDMYSLKALKEKLDAGRMFYLAYEGEKAVGYIALTALSEQSVLRIESLYLLPETQGKGFGKQLIDFAAEKALNEKLRVLELNVNRGNKAQLFYKKQGFIIVREVDIPYHGYVLDDYVMQKSL